MEADVLKAIDKASAWLDIEGVEGVGQGSKDGEVCIVVGCSCAPAELKGQIPDSFMSYPVVFESWGIVSAQTEE